MEMKFTSENFDTEVLNSDVPVVVDFFATWCGPCKMMAPAVEALAEEYDGKVKIGKIDVDENSDIAAQYGIMSIPTVIMFKNGEIAGKSIGLQSKDELKKGIDGLL
jgi:thioredoxin 1